MEKARSLLGDSSNPLKVGASFVTGHGSVGNFKETVLPIIKRHQPAAVWLFAPDGDLKPHKAIIAALKSLEPSPQVFVQVGNVAAAVEAIEDGADVLVLQGVDAGGHQFRRGAGVVSFVPEVKSILQKKFLEKDIRIVAAGGIADGRGVAAALALGKLNIISLLEDGANIFEVRMEL